MPLGLAALALGVALLPPQAAAARQKADAASLDLRLRPGDLRLPPLPSPRRPSGEEPPLDQPRSAAETDRVERALIPQRHRGGELFLVGDGGFLEELLEDSTIPLFRVTVEPPF